MSSMCGNLILCKIEIPNHGKGKANYGHHGVHPLIAQTALSLHAIFGKRKIDKLQKALKSYRTLTLARALRENKIPYEYHQRNTISVDLADSRTSKLYHVLIKGGKFKYTVHVHTDELSTSIHSIDRKEYPFTDGYALVANMILDKTITSLANTMSPDDQYSNYPTQCLSAKQYREILSHKTLNPTNQ